MSNSKELPFTSPLPLLLPSNGKMKLVEQTAAILEKIQQPVVAVAIAGKYRTGKSYILNLLSNLPRNAGFALGSTVQSKTQGIWIYALPHPSLPNTMLLLLDTEGLGDVAKGDEQYDTTLLVLTILLSSTFILNVVGKLDDAVINQLALVSTVTKNMKTKTDGSEIDEDFSSFFPQLFILVRDFCLELKANGKEISADDYFNDFCLKEKSSKDSDDSDSRGLVRKHFPKRCCLTIAPPVFEKELLQKLETIPDDQLNPEFLEESQKFVKTVLSVSTTKTFIKSMPVNGNLLVTFLRQYLVQIQNGSVPCVQTSLQSTAEVENKKIIQEYVCRYESLLRASVKLPTSHKAIVDIHRKLAADLIENVKQKIIFDSEKANVENNFKNEIEKVFNKLLSENEGKSKQECLERLTKLSVNLNEKLNKNSFSKRGGHAEYSKELQTVITNYNNVKEKGIKHDEVLSQFVLKQDNEGKRLLAMEEELAKKEREAEDARKEKERAEQRAKLEQELAEKARKEAEEQRKIQEENEKRLQQEIEERNRQEEALRRQLEEQRIQDEQRRRHKKKRGLAKIFRF